MKTCCWIIVFTLLGMGTCLGQTFNEWWRQKKTQRKYLIEQIAALRLYASFVKTGYNIARDGTGTISRITQGEFSLHDLFFQHLGRVNPRIREYAEATDIVARQVAITTTCHQALTLAQRSGRFSAVEVDRLHTSVAGLLEDVAATVQEMAQILTDGALQMEDARRLQRIVDISGRSVKQQQAARQLYADIEGVDLARAREESALASFKLIYGIKK